MFGQARTNLFRVKDETTFREWADEFGVKVHSTATGSFAVFPEDDAEGKFPTDAYDEESEEYYEVEFHEELARHLAPGSVAVVMEVSFERRDLGGSAYAVDHTGKVISLHLHDIFKKAKEAFEGEVNSF